MLTNHQTAQIDHYAVMGNPIAHSQSPFIHTAFAQQTGQTLQYDAILVGTQSGEFAQAVQAFCAAGGKGLNITVPFKQDAYALAEHCTERAERAGAVNTLWFDEQNRIIGDNTDGVGFVRDLTQNQGYHIAGQRILILGAGGAVRGVLGPILEAAPVECVIANRTVSKAETLATLFAPLGPVTACAYDDLAGQTYDLIINGTSASLQGQLPPLPEGLLAENAWCYDMMYAATLFVQWAQEKGAAGAYDGLGMLVEQAAESFYQWRGIRPETVPVIQQVRDFRLRQDRTEPDK
ncbi:MAG TPA: shikimate dehydrogenase [Thiotrichaceae bacterium]|nr:shikimate dehydrogenase [Thiotrichaceae bacterium]